MLHCDVSCRAGAELFLFIDKSWISCCIRAGRVKAAKGGLRFIHSSTIMALLSREGKGCLWLWGSGHRVVVLPSIQFVEAKS